MSLTADMGDFLGRQMKALNDRVVVLENNTVEGGGGSSGVTIKNYEPGILYIKKEMPSGTLYLEWAKDFDWSNGSMFVEAINIGTGGILTSECLCQVKIGKSSLLTEYDDHWEYKAWTSRYKDTLNAADIVIVFCTEADYSSSAASYFWAKNKGYGDYG